MVAWFEIPVIDMNRAVTFYQSVFQVELEQHQFGEEQMAWFPYHQEGSQTISGALVKHTKHYTPSDKGVLVYFSSTDVNVELNRVVVAGGKIMDAKKLISEEIGYMATFLDTEGNIIALHSKG